MHDNVIVHDIVVLKINLSMLIVTKLQFGFYRVVSVMSDAPPLSQGEHV